METDRMSISRNSPKRSSAQATRFSPSTTATVSPNGRIEGTDNKIGVLKRIAYGSTNVDNFGARAPLVASSP